MKFSRMTEIQEALFQRIRDVRASKGMEYATEEDTLADFKEVAAELGVGPLTVWGVYVKKHLRAIDSFIREGQVRSESIEDRIMDVVTYHILLLGLVEDLQGTDVDIADLEVVLDDSPILQCERHVGVRWPHGECPGPGMPLMDEPPPKRADGTTPMPDLGADALIDPPYEPGAGPTALDRAAHAFDPSVRTMGQGG